MVELETMESDGRMAEYVKQEQSMLRRELNRLNIRLNGIRDLNSKPDAMFIVDIKREHNALAEARRLRVPIVAIVDTNTDPTLVDYPIAGNDDAIRSIKAILDPLPQPIIDARAAYNATSEKLKAEADKKTDPSKDLSTKPSASTEEEEKPSASTEEEEKPDESTEVKVESDSN
jgi:small subunit ribosomal protein S2